MDSGPLAGTGLDVTFNTDWSADWRIVTGPRQGLAGRAREFAQHSVRDGLCIVSFAIADDETIAANVDFDSRRFIGFVIRGAAATAIAGALRSL